MRQDGRKLDHQTLERIRLDAIVRVRAGERPSNVAASVGFCRTTVYKWLRAVRNHQGSTQCLASTTASGRPRRLGAADEQRLVEQIDGKTPADNGLPGRLWNRHLVARLIARDYALSLQIGAVGLLLARLGLLPGAAPFSARADKDASVAAWHEEVYPQLLRRAKSAGAEILHWSRFPAPAGNTRARPSWVAAAVNAKREFWVMRCDGAVDDAGLVAIIARMMHGRGKAAYLVLDDCRQHRGAALRQYVARLDGALEIHLLPAPGRRATPGR
jgi:transposase